MGNEHTARVAAGVDSPEPWLWRPEVGRWRPDFGLPRTPAVVQLSTTAATQREAFDFWRDLVFYNFDADPLPLHERARFRASGIGTPSERAEIYHWTSSAMQGRRTEDQIGRDGEDAVAIGFVLDGERLAQDGDGREFLSREGEPFVYDSARQSKLRWTDHEGVYIWVRRSEVTAMLGSNVPAMADLTARIAALPSAAIIRDQLTATARAFPSLSGPERAFMLDQAARMASFALLAAGAGRPQDDRSARASVHAAAVRLIDRELARPDLSPELLAARLGCSRATLYRAFADAQQTVAGAIQSARLDRAKAMLFAAGPDVPIGDIAARCGYYDLSSFSARFRRRFGCRPGDLRRH